MGRSEIAHKHKCPSCKYIWQHPDSVCDTDEDCFRSHVCPNCGRYDRALADGPSTRNVYSGPKKPNAVFDGPHGQLPPDPYKSNKGVK